VRKALKAKSTKKAQKLFKRSSKLLDAVLKAVDKAGRKKKRPLAAECVAALRALVLDTKARVEARIAG
jgi:hypothetical protein